MVRDSSPVCFRVSPEEREILDMVANYQLESISSFVRHGILDVAREIIDEVGADRIQEAYRPMRDANAARERRRIEIEQHLSGSSTSR